MKRAYLLAGGRSRRYGSDKARVLVRGAPLVLGLAKDLHQLGWHVSIVAQAEADYNDLGLRTLPDVYPHGGPLAGLITALADCRSAAEPYALIANCDLVPGNWEWLSPLEQGFEEGSSSMIVLASDPFMPLPGLYATRVLDAALDLWEAGRRSLRDLHEQMKGSIAAIAWPAENMPRSFNTPTELRDILEPGSNH